jgi:hypothetical protein
MPSACEASDSSRRASQIDGEFPSSGSTPYLAKPVPPGRPFQSIPAGHSDKNQADRFDPVLDDYVAADVAVRQRGAHGRKAAGRVEGGRDSRATVAIREHPAAETFDRTVELGKTPRPEP